MHVSECINRDNEQALFDCSPSLQLLSRPDSSYAAARPPAQPAAKAKDDDGWETVTKGGKGAGGDGWSQARTYFVKRRAACHFYLGHTVRTPIQTLVARNAHAIYVACLRFDDVVRRHWTCECMLLLVVVRSSP